MSNISDLLNESPSSFVERQKERMDGQSMMSSVGGSTTTFINDSNTYSGSLSSDTSAQEPCLSEKGRKQKIEMAINGLNMDEKALHALKDAFDLGKSASAHTVGEEITSALLGLSTVDGVINRAIPKIPYNGKPSAAPYNLLPSFSSINNYNPYASKPPPSNMPNMSTHVKRQQPPSSFRPRPVKKVKELSAFSIKLRQSETCWEITAFSSEFESPQITVRLVKCPGNPNDPRQRDAIILHASRFTTIESPDGSMLEKTIEKRSLIPLSGLAIPQSIRIQHFRKGFIKVRISKQK